jgi:predicted GIY-YIG superfamily endonuclease
MATKRELAIKKMTRPNKEMLFQKV